MSLIATTAPSPSRHRVTGKNAGDEDYPFGSFLLPKHLRVHVAAFYRFAREADDIADKPDCDLATKLALLARLEDCLEGAEDDDPAMRAARSLRHTLREVHLDAAPAKALLAAFRRDAAGWHCESWEDLLGYCELSAVPVGRFLLALHGEGPSTHAAADALCAAVQILNHVQDCRADWLALGRIYLPESWLRGEGVPRTELGESSCSPELRRVIDQTLDGACRLLDKAEPLPQLLRSPRLRAEAAVIHAIAQRLARRLRAQDPLRSKVRLGPASVAAAFCDGLWRAVTVR